MLAGVIHVENGTCMLEMVEEKVCVRKNCNWRIVCREISYIPNHFDILLREYIGFSYIA